MLAYVLSGLGLSASSGLNAYLPLLILALADRFSTIIELRDPFDVLSSPWVILALLLVLPLELILDKIPRVDVLSDRIHMGLRIAAGAIAMMAVTGQSNGFHQLLGAVLGAAIASLAHVTKARARPAVTRATAGIANPFVSMVEDFAVVIVSVTACLLPYGVVLALPIFAISLWRLYSRMSSTPVRIGSLVLPHTKS